MMVVALRLTSGSRLAATYPIHPEVFDRLYEDWSTLVKFRRSLVPLMPAAGFGINCLHQMQKR